MALLAESDQSNTYHKGEAALSELLASSSKPILVMFMSKTCGPCRILKPILGRVLKVRVGIRLDVCAFYYFYFFIFSVLLPCMAFNVSGILVKDLRACSI